MPVSRVSRLFASSVWKKLTSHVILVSAQSDAFCRDVCITLTVQQAFFGKKHNLSEYIIKWKKCIFQM